MGDKDWTNLKEISISDHMTDSRPNEQPSQDKPDDADGTWLVILLLF
jgi:hypothetical protein